MEDACCFRMQEWAGHRRSKLEAGHCSQAGKSGGTLLVHVTPMRGHPLSEKVM